MGRFWRIFTTVLAVTGGVVGEKVSKNPTDTITSGGSISRTGYQPNHNMDPNVIKSGTFNQIWKTQGLGKYNGFTEQFYAQPLVYTPVDTQYVYVISQQNIAYILDAKTGQIIKYRTIHIPFLVTPDLAGCNDVADCVGSTATGVIDPDTGTWFFTTKTYADQAKTTPQGLAAGRYYIHAVDVLTLEEKPNFPIPLEGMKADNAPWRVFEGGKHHQRPALLQVNNYVYAGFASHCVQWNFTGWVVGWHATEGRIVTKYAMEGGKEANGIGGGIWMSGGGIASDNPGRMFFATGNGYASQLADDPVPGRQPPTALEEAVVNMAIAGDGSLTPTDFFMPWEKRDLDGMDKDLGTSSFVLLEPNVFSTSKVQRIGAVAGKTGKLYFLNLDDLGGYQMGENRKDKILQTIALEGPVFASAGTYPHDGGYVYLSPVGRQTVAFKFGINSNGDPVFTQAGKTTETTAGRQGVGHTTVTSMNGQPGSGILWISDVDGANLRAYSTIPVNGVLPTLALLNNVGQMKFSRPSFGDGRVYLTSHTGYITAFGSPVNMPLNCSSPYDAGTVPIGNTSTTVITCRAKIPLTINSTILDDGTNFKTFGYTLPKTLAIGETFSFTANFTPKSVGPLSTNINIQTINGGTEQFSTNTPVVIRGVAVSLSPILTIQPNVLSFGEVITGEDTAGKDLDFTMQNDGQSPLVIQGYKISLNSSTGPFLPAQPFPLKAGPFTFVDLPAVNSSIAGNGAVSTTVNFNPTVDGYYGAYLVITTNGGEKFVGSFGTAGGKPKALLEWQLGNGTWVAYQKGVPFAFGPVPLGTQAFRKLRLRNLGGTNLTTSVSKPPVSGALAAVNPLGSIPEGSQVAPNGSIEATLICSPPKSQVNEDPTTLTAVWTMNNNDAAFGKTEIDFTCNGASNQVGPLDENGQGWYRYLGCFKDANPNRNLEELLYYSTNNTNGKCQFDCMNQGPQFAYAATEYEGECWCGTKRAVEKVADTFCQYLCRGDFREYCGGNGAYMSLFGDRRKVGNISTITASLTSTTLTSSSTSASVSTTTAGNSSVTITSTSTSATTSPTAPPNLSYLGCANEGTTGRALAKDATADPLMTITLCATYCTNKGYSLSGLEYSTECYCGSALENGSKFGGSTACNMPCGGDAATICGGPGALSVYNNTALVPPRQPSIVPSVGNYQSLGCYTEGVNERALTGAGTAAPDMTVQSCVAYCLAAGFKYAGTEYSTECFCSAAIATTAKSAPASECNMLCGGDKYAYCGGPSRLNVYGNLNGTVTSVPPTSTTTSTPVTSSVNGTATSTTSTGTSSAPTLRPGYTYLGCANEGTSGRALAKDATASSTMTTNMCQDYCTGKGYPLSGVEYSTECYCGSILENGSKIGGSTACNMQCGGAPNSICGGPGALSVYNNTALVAPRQPAVVPVVGNYKSQGCYTEGVNERALAGSGTANVNMTVQLCISYCQTGGYKYAGIEYSTECFCGSAIATTAKTAPASECSMLCGGDQFAYCGGPSRLNVYANLNGTTGSSSTTSTTSSTTGGSVSGTATTTSTSATTSTTGTSTPTLRAGYAYLGCANEGTNGRALSKDATASSTMTTTICQDYCTGKGYPLSGVEYSTECYCGNVLENGSTIGGSTVCNMPCGGAPNSICGGPGALSVYNNTALVAPKQPAVVPTVGNYKSQGCYTEGVNERALAGSGTASVNMTVQSCISFCQSGGYQYAGIEYSTECFCGSAIATTAKTAPASECNMLCGGDRLAYCGGPNRLNVYQNMNGTTSSSSSSALATSASASTTTASGTTTSASTTSKSNTSTTAGGTTTPTLRAGYAYLGCANEGTGGRALAKDSTASSTMTTVVCQDYCTGKGYSLSGVEYSTECYCGNALENGSTIGGSTVCTMPCGGAPNLICGGPRALSVYNNTALVAPKQPAVVPAAGGYGSQGCYTEGANERALAGPGTANANMTVQSCVSYCQNGGYKYAGIEYSTECFCGSAIATTAKTAPASECNMLCGGDKFAYCGGPNRLNIYGKVNGTTSSSSSTSIPATSASLSSTAASGTTTSTGTTSKSSTSTATTTGSSSSAASPTIRPGYTYLGCANEGTNGRALSKAATASSTMTPNVCQDYCTGKGYPLSGIEYSTECYCGNVLENGSSIGGSTSCTMPCGGSPSTICGGPSALSVYNNTAITPPKQPIMIPAAAGYNLTGCWAEGTNERALAASATASASMNVTMCVNFCKSGGYAYAGVEYATECYCGSTVAGTAKNVSASQCNMVCGGDAGAYCGGSGRLGIYYGGSSGAVTAAKAAGAAGPVSVSTNSNSSSTVPTSSSSSSSSSSSTLSASSGSSGSGSSPSTSTSTNAIGSTTTSNASTTTSNTTSSSSTTSTSSSTSTSSLSSSSSPSSSSSSSPTASTAPSSTPSTYAYLGCANSTSPPALTGPTTSSSTSLTPSGCQDFCTSNNYTLSGLSPSTCSCGTALQNNSTLTATSPCPSSYLSIYNSTLQISPTLPHVIHTYNYTACYVDPTPSGHLLTGFAFVNESLTLEMCVGECKTRGWGWAGVNNGQECSCGSGERLGNATKVGTAECMGVVCAGDQREWCSGVDRVAVWWDVWGL